MLAWWLPSEIIRTSVCVPYLLAAIWGQHLFHSRASDCVPTIRGQWPFEGSDHSRAVTIQEQWPFEGSDYSRAVTVWGWWPFEDGIYSWGQVTDSRNYAQWLQSLLLKDHAQTMLTHSRDSAHDLSVKPSPCLCSCPGRQTLLLRLNAWSTSEDGPWNKQCPAHLG